MKIYIERLWSALLGRGYIEESYIHNLKDFFLLLVIDFIESDRKNYPIGLDKDEWEDRLNTLKEVLYKYFDGYYYQNSEEFNKDSDFIQKELSDILFNLWE